MNALEEQRKQLLHWMVHCPKGSEVEARVTASYKSMKPKREVIHARNTTETETTFNQYEITLFNEGMPDV